MSRNFETEKNDFHFKFYSTITKTGNILSKKYKNAQYFILIFLKTPTFKELIILCEYLSSGVNQLGGNVGADAPRDLFALCITLAGV